MPPTSISWSSSNPNVATVDEYGKVTGVSAGTAVITVTSADGGFTATCTVTVSQLVLETSATVDLGLPSGLIWATCNTGATSPEVFGTFTNWADIVPNEDWQTPTKAQFEELIAECKQSVLIYNGVRGLLFTSLANGNHLFFPMAGANHSEYGPVGEGYYVLLWTATEDGDKAYVAEYNGQTFEVNEAIGKAELSCPMRAVKVQ